MENENDLELLSSLENNLEGFDDPELLPSFEDPVIDNPNVDPILSKPKPKDPTATEFDLISEALKARGIKDLSNIKIETDLGITNVAFEDLTNEEKLQILNTSLNEDYELEDDEIKLISFLRDNELGTDDLVEYYKQLGIQEYIENNKQFNVDTLSDEDVLALDLNTRYEDWTPEEILDEVERAKGNPSLFAKRVNKLRETLKEQERQELESQSQSQSKEPDPEVSKKFMEDFKNCGEKYRNFSGVDLEDSDLSSTYEYAFKPTLNGSSKLAQDLNDPDRLFKMALFMAHGDEILQNLHTIYQKELKEKDKKIIGQVPKNPKSPSTSTMAKKSADLTRTNIGDLRAFLELEANK